MLWVLLVMLFTADGDKAIHAEFQPDQASCEAKVAKLKADIEADRPAELRAAGAFCLAVSPGPKKEI